MNIWVPRMKIIEPNAELKSAGPAFEGRYIMEAVRLDGTRRPLADFKNVITDIGLNRIGANGDWLNNCQVGTGSNAATTSDTQLQSFVASTSSLNVNTETAQASSPYYSQRLRTFRFGLGAAAGNLSEVGVGWAATNTAALFSRARILDGSGNPTTITVLSDEYLDVTYVCRKYPSTTDTTGTVVIAGTTYDYTVRAAYVTNISYQKIPESAGSSNVAYGESVGAGSGTITAITTGPSTTTIAPSYAAYVNNSYQRDCTATWGLTQANYAGGIQSFINLGPFSAYQVGVSPAIPKTASQTLSVTLRISWARRP